MDEAPPKVIALAGPNGAGKSTVAPLMLHHAYGLTEFVNADTIARGLSAYAPESVAFEAGRIMLRRLRDLANRRVNFAFETTLATRSYASWVRGLRRDGYEFNLMFLWLRSPELSVQRVRERVRAGGHDVPEEVIRRRYQKGLRNFFNLYQALSNSWAVYDNSSPGNPRVIAKGDEGGPTYIPEKDDWRLFVRQGNESAT